MLGLHALIRLLDSMDHPLQILLGICAGNWVLAVVAHTMAVLSIKGFSKIMEQKDPPTATGLHVPEGFLDQLLSDLLFGHRFVVQKLLKLLNILVAVKGQAMSSCAISACPASLLVIAFEALWNIVVDNESNIQIVEIYSLELKPNLYYSFCLL